MCKPADTLGMCGWEPLSLHVCISEDCFTWYSRSVVGRESENVSQSVVSDSATPRTVAHQAPLPMGFSRQEYWSGLPFTSPGDLPNSGIEPGSSALQADSLPTELQGKPLFPHRALAKGPYQAASIKGDKRP